MFRTIVIFSILVPTFAFPPSRPLDTPNGQDGKIVGGQSTTIDKFPYQVSLRSNGSHFCGGSIYRSNIIISAAHCFQDDHPKLTVVAGSTSKTFGGLISNVKEVIMHPNFQGATFDYDVVVILLEKEIPFGPTIQPIGLATANKEAIIGSRSYVSGWGAVHESGTSTDQLQYVAVMVLKRSICAEAYKQYLVSERMLCAGEEVGGKDACQGDSGGPLVLQNKVIGIVSWGVGCARYQQPGVYSNVAVLREWIDETVNALLKSV